MEEETDYIIPCLRRYGNTFITLKDLEKVGGEKIFLQILKAKGLDCELVESTECSQYEQKGGRSYAHKIVQIRRKA